MTNKSILSFIIFAICAGYANNMDSLYISILPKDSVIMGCGCSFWYEEGEAIFDKIFASSKLGKDEMLFGVSGNVVRLKRSLYNVTKRKLKNRFSIGDEITEKYVGSNINIELRYVITFVCPPDTEGGCEVIRYKGMLNLSSKEKSQIYKIEGDCGC